MRRRTPRGELPERPTGWPLWIPRLIMAASLILGTATLVLLVSYLPSTGTLALLLAAILTIAGYILPYFLGIKIWRKAVARRHTSD